MGFQQRHILSARRLRLLVAGWLLMAALPAHAQMLTGYRDTSDPVAPPALIAPTEPIPATSVPAPEEIENYRPYTGPKLAMFAHGDEPAQTRPVPSQPVMTQPVMTGADVAADTPSEPLAVMPMNDTAAMLPAADKGDVTNTAPVDLTADTLEHDDKSGEVTATGHVELQQAGRILHADKVTYNLNTGVARAVGNVILNEANGDVHFADEVELSEEMSNGFVVGLKSYLANGGRFEAKRGEREHSTLLTMHEASYTPCDCETDDDGNPVWQIKATRVTYDEVAHKISYKNPHFELFGVPVFWSPYLSHSDGKEKRKSGLLTPDVGYDSTLGVIVTQDYYWNIAPDRDATIGTMLTSKEMPVALGEYRQRWNNAEMTVNGSVTRSGRTDNINGADVDLKDEWRGHVMGDARWEINHKWRSGLKLELASDDQYLRQYDFSSKDVLENEAYVERFSGRNYASVKALAFQDVRVADEKTDQPNILPEAEVSFIGEPNATLGGRWSVDASALDLVRDGSGQDVMRGVVRTGWKRQDKTSWGLVNTLDLSVRGDIYGVSDRDLAVPGSGLSSDSRETRVFPQAHMVTSLPLVKPLTRSQILVEPIVALTAAPNINSDDDRIPNEDSQDVQLDAANLFSANRFAGLDRIEDRSRITYGVRSGIYNDNGGRLTGFFGQSHNFNDDDNPFPVGSGLSNQESDFVGSVSALYLDRFGANYRFQLDSHDMSSQRHEFDSFAYWNRLRVGGRYLYATGLEGTNIDESREQAEGNLAYFLTDHWRTRLGALYDLGEDPGLRKAVMGIDFYGCCLSLSATAERKLTTDSSGDSGTNVMLRLGLKGLGEFESAQDNHWNGVTD